MCNVYELHGIMIFANIYMDIFHNPFHQLSDKLTRSLGDGNEFRKSIMHVCVRLEKGYLIFQKTMCIVLSCTTFIV